MKIDQCLETELGKQYALDYQFMAAARLHQSKYRRDVLKAGFDKYGSMLTETGGKNLLNYYEFLGVREELRAKYPTYSRMRDANMLRSEHIPFNMFAPLIGRNELARQVYSSAFGIAIQGVLSTAIEFAPDPKGDYLNDRTSFDVYVEYMNAEGAKCALGIEVKYTEHEYGIGKREKENIENRNSKYWALTSSSGIFRDDNQDGLASDTMRQIWRNHLLGLAMKAKRLIQDFTSVTVHPSGNTHFIDALAEYKRHLLPDGRESVQGCTFEQFIDAIPGGKDDILHWKQYLHSRYIVQT